jgi:hypothetical protein
VAVLYLQPDMASRINPIFALNMLMNYFESTIENGTEGAR